MFNALRRLIQRYGFFRREHAGLPFDDQGSIFWYNDSFFTEEKRRNERLAAIASEISALNVKRLKAKEQRKNQKVFENQMTALMAERLRIEAGEEVVK